MSQRVVVIDYGMGNVHSVLNALNFLGIEATLSSHQDSIQKAGLLILPGVGAFRDGMKELHQRGLVSLIQEHVLAGRSLLGICLGMQLLLSESYEMGTHRGLNIVQGCVQPFEHSSKPDLHFKTPHMGWNSIEICQDDPVFEQLNTPAYVYFVHSYIVCPEREDVILATTEYSQTFCSVLRQGSVYGMQFHPEKSQSLGLHMLKNICKQAFLQQKEAS